MFKLYIFGSLILYLIYIFTSSSYSNNFDKLNNFDRLNNSDNSNNSDKLNDKKIDFVDKMIEKYGYFLDNQQQLYLKTNMINSKKFFDIIDELYLGKEINNKKRNISTYFLVGKAFMTTYLDSTPNCLRIINNSHEKYEYGFIYTEFCSTEIKEIDQLKIICAGILFHNILSNKNLELSDDESLLLQRLKKKYCIDDIIDNIYSIIYENKDKMIRLKNILDDNKSIFYNI